MLVRLSKQIAGKVQRTYWLQKTRNAESYRNPTDRQLAEIERELLKLDVEVENYSPDPKKFELFKKRFPFPPDYQNATGGIWDEKLLEHYIAYELVGLELFEKKDVYVDVAACSSPWASILREKLEIQSWAVDLNVPEKYESIHYYTAQDATAMSFETGSVRGVSLQCAFEMFAGENDVNLIRELARVLSPGSRCVIVPLYMHTNYCGFSTPEYFGGGHADSGAKEYVQRDYFGVPFARNYDAKTLKTRILDVINGFGMTYRILGLRNKVDLGKDIYCHFILEVTR